MPNRVRLGPASVLRLLLLFALLGSATTWAEESHEARSKDYLRVCVDPNNLPYSNSKGEGFEVEIAELIGRELGRPVQYRWWPQSVGFVRNTIRVRLCDLVMGITSASELVQNTNPYYRSVYALVYRADSELKPKTLEDGDSSLSKLRIGVVAGTPPVSVLGKLGLLDRIKSYERTVDTRLYSPARDAIEDVAKGETDLAIIWGPIAGYYATRQAVPLTVVPLPAQIRSVPLAFNVSLGIRQSENDWKHELNALLEQLEPQIRPILSRYGVPLLDQRDQLITP